MTEYKTNVLRLYRNGLCAREIARELDRTSQAINSVLYELRRSGELETSAEERAMRRRMSQMKAYEHDRFLANRSK